MRKLLFLSVSIALLSLLFTACRQEAYGLPADLADTFQADADIVTGPEAGSAKSTSLPASEAEEEPLKPSLLLTFGGDIMAHNVNFNMKDFNDIYTDVTDVLQQDDLSFVNLEFPVYDKVPMSTFPMFNVHPPYVEAAVDAGFDVFSIANNHSTDKGPKGVIATYAVMEEFANTRDIFFSGIRNNSDKPYVPVSINKDGWKIGFLAVTQWLNTYWGGDYAHYLHYEEEEAKTAFFKLLDTHTKDYDVFILSFHGGVEYATVPDKAKIDFFNECLDHGVDIIWAHHPHVLQPWHLDRNREGGKLLLYSAGNFISGQAWYVDPKSPDQPRNYTGDGALFQVRLQDIGKQYKIRTVIPVLLTNYKHPEKGMVSRKLAELPRDTKIPDIWRKYYKRRLQVITSHLADYSVPNVLP